MTCGSFVRAAKRAGSVGAGSNLERQARESILRSTARGWGHAALLKIPKLSDALEALEGPLRSPNWRSFSLPESSQEARSEAAMEAVTRCMSAAPCPSQASASLKLGWPKLVLSTTPMPFSGFSVGALLHLNVNRSLSDFHRRPSGRE